MSNDHQNGNVTVSAAQAEQLLRKSELSYRRLFEAARDGILILDVDNGHITDVNPYLMELLGFSHEEMVGKTVGELSPFKDVVSNRAMLERLQKDGYVRYHDLPLETKDGRKIAVEFVSNVYQSGDKKVIQCNIRDITERKQLEAQFVEAQKMEVIGHLASGVAHDFNNILGVIIGYNDLMMPELAPDSLSQKCADEIRHAAERAAALTRQLLLFSRKQTVQPTVLDLHEVVEGMDKMLRRLIDENVELTIVPQKETGRIKADSGLVGQLLLNLVVNARDAMPNGGRLRIETADVTFDKEHASTHTDATPGDYVMLAVTDTGIGMSAEIKAHLFEAFFTTKPKGKGTGLGLTTCQTIVKQCGGFIDLQSEPGKGSTFKIYFPRVEQAADPVDMFKKSTTVRPLTRGIETLLFVEDDPSVRQLACSILEAQGYNVLRANNGQDGLRMARECKGAPISLVITDIIMPQMSGKVMAEWLKATYPDIKVLFTSGYTDDTIVEHGVLEPGTAFLPKPYLPDVLLRKVREMLDKESDSTFLRKQSLVANQSP